MQSCLEQLFSKKVKDCNIIVAFYFILQDILTDLNAEGEPLPIRPVNEEWMGHKVIDCNNQYLNETFPNIETMILIGNTCSYTIMYLK